MRCPLIDAGCTRSRDYVKERIPESNLVPRACESVDPLEAGWSYQLLALNLLFASQRERTR